MERKLGETIYLMFTTSHPDTGAITDADSLPDVEVYEENTEAPQSTPAPSKVIGKTGLYRVPIVATIGNSFEVNKTYNVVAIATVNAIESKIPLSTFILRTNTIDDVDTVVDVIQAKTDNLPADPADQSLVESAITTSETNIRGADSDTLETLSDQIDGVQSDLDSPAQYKADVSALALEANVEGHATDALTTYDPPKRSEATSDKDEILTQVALVPTATEIDTKLTNSHGAGSWGPADVSGLALEASVQSIVTLVTRILGVAKENQYIDTVTHDSENSLTSARLRIYSVAGSVGTNNDVLATYTITTTYNTNNEMISYGVVKV